MVVMSMKPNQGDTAAPRRRGSFLGAASVACALALAACSVQQAQPPAAPTASPQASAATVAPPPPKTGIVPASAPGRGSGLSNYGERLPTADYLALTTGNTLFRPLADGGKTFIFIAANKTLSMFLISPTGQKTIESGLQTVSGNDICWHLKGPKQPLCFVPYSNGRLLTFSFLGGVVEPAQFLVSKGNVLHLNPG